MAKNKPRRPDFNLSALDKTTEVRGKVGAAWKNDDGTISIRLDPFVVLSGSSNLELRLFVNDGQYQPLRPAAPPPADQNEYGDALPY